MSTTNEPTFVANLPLRGQSPNRELIAHAYETHGLERAGLGIPHSFIPRHSNCSYLRDMPATNGAQEAVNTGEEVPSITVRRDSLRPSTHSNLSGGIGPARTTRFHTNVSVNTDLETVCLKLRVDGFIFNNFW
jgi:hypothetical protein